MKSIWRSFALLVILNLADFVITAVHIHRVGIEGELNPFLQYLILSFGVGVILTVKIFFLSILGYAMWLYTKEDAKYEINRIAVALFILNAIFLAVVAWGLFCVL